MDIFEITTDSDATIHTYTSDKSYKWFKAGIEAESTLASYDKAIMLNMINEPFNSEYVFTQKVDKYFNHPGNFSAQYFLNGYFRNLNFEFLVKGNILRIK